MVLENGHDWSESITQHGHYGIVWPLVTWSATIPLMVAVWTVFVWNGNVVRTLAGADFILLFFILLVHLYLVTSNLDEPVRNMGGFGGPGRGRMTEVAFGTGGVLLGMSLPVWLMIGFSAFLKGGRRPQRQY